MIWISILIDSEGICRWSCWKKVSTKL